MRRLILFLAFSAIAFAQPQVLPQCTGNSSKNCTPKVNSSGAYVPTAGSGSFTQLSGDAISGVSGGATTINFVSVTTLPSAASAVIGRPYRMTAATTANVCPTAGDSAGSSLAYCVSNGTTYASLIVAPGSTGNVALPGTLSVGNTVQFPDGSDQASASLFTAPPYFVYDNFHRANTSAGSLSNTPSPFGQVWSLQYPPVGTGVPATTGQISNNSIHYAISAIKRRLHHELHRAIHAQRQ